jgi:hypothetical protein
VLGVVALVALQASLLHRLLGMPYPMARTAIFLLPPVVVFLMLFADALATFGRGARVAVTAVMLILSAVSTWNGVRAANVTRTLDWPHDTTTVQMLDAIAESDDDANPPSVVRVGVEWMFYPVARYYADRQSNDVTRYDIVVLPGDGRPLDFTYAISAEVAGRGDLVRSYPDSGASLRRVD